MKFPLVTTSGKSWIFVPPPVKFDSKTFDFQDFVANQDYDSATIRLYSLGIRMFMDWVRDVACKVFDDLSVYDFIEYKRWLSLKDLSNSTKNSYLTGVMTMYMLLEKHGIDNICKGVRKFDVAEGYVKEGIAIEDWKRVLGMIDRGKFNGKKHYLVIYMLFVSGVRQMSLCDLKWGDFAFDSSVNGLVMNCRMKGRGMRSEKVVLNSECVQILMEYKAMYQQHYCRVKTGLVGIHGGMAEVGDDLYVFGNRDKKISDVGMRKISLTWLKKAGLYKKGVITPHSWRHGIAEHLIDKGLALTDVQQFLCHRSISSTKVYAGKKEKIRVDKVLLSTINEINIKDESEVNLTDFY